MVLDIIRIKICHLKADDKGESSGKLNLNGLDIEGLKASQLFQDRIDHFP